ncbi:MAG: glyoxalase [Lachnospiraceae bacterium]
MRAYDDECIEVFLNNQLQLFDQPVAEDEFEAEEFLEDAMAVVCHSIREVRNYMDDAGMDVDFMSDQDLIEAAEVFPLSQGRYLVVQG